MKAISRRVRASAGRWLPVLAITALLVLVSCAPGGNAIRNVADKDGDVAGFWLGLWHGIIAPFTFIVSLWSNHVNVYEVHNNGNWYNFGFVLGAGILLGGGGIMGRQRRKG